MIILCAHVTVCRRPEVVTRVTECGHQVATSVTACGRPEVVTTVTLWLAGCQVAHCMTTCVCGRPEVVTPVTVWLPGCECQVAHCMSVCLARCMSVWLMGGVASRFLTPVQLSTESHIE